MSNLKIAYIIEFYATFILEEIEELRRQGAEVLLLSAFRPVPENDPKKEAYRKESLYFAPHYKGAISANLRALLRRPIAYVRAAWRLLREGESLRFLLLGGNFSELLRRAGVNHIHATFGTRTTTLAYVLMELANVEYSFTTHAYDIFYRNESLLWKTKKASFMRTISKYNKEYLKTEYAGIASDKIIVNYLGVDTRKFQPESNGKSANRKINIVAVGDLIEKKGHGYLVQACAKLKQEGIEFQCDIIGEGVLREPLQEEIDRLNLSDNVRLLGALKHQEVIKHLAQAQLFTLSCVDVRGKGGDLDGIPVALMEAMAMGLPTISTNISGITELIEDGVSGLIVPERDENALAEALRQLISNQSLRQQFEHSARRRIEEEFDLSKNTSRLAKMFETA
jgi:glycosyltransferase involved in cell wall biosynthesis